MLKILLILILVKQHWSLELQYCSNAPPDQVCKLVDDYDKNVVPGKLPLTISPGLDVHEVVEIDTFKGTMTVLVYVYVFWTDPNLSYKPEKMKNGIAFSEETAKLIWHPFLSFLNIKEMKPMRGFGYDEHHEYYLSGTSDFQSVEILEVTVHCNYELTLFPFDYQECDFSLFELRNDVDSVILKEFVLFYKSHLNVKNLPQQYGIPYEIAMKSHVENVTWDAFGQYSISTLRFSMQRNSIDLLLGSFYIPTGLFGFLSMASYIMNPDTDGRMGLTITLYLITFIVYSSVSAMSPPARGFSYIEIWMAGVVATISIAILEHVFILAFKRMNVFANPDHVAKLIDGISLIFTFSFFIFFIVIYWLKACGFF